MSPKEALNLMVPVPALPAESVAVAVRFALAPLLRMLLTSVEMATLPFVGLLGAAVVLVQAASAIVDAAAASLARNEIFTCGTLPNFGDPRRHPRKESVPTLIWTAPEGAVNILAGGFCVGSGERDPFGRAAGRAHRCARFH